MKKSVEKSYIPSGFIYDDHEKLIKNCKADFKSLTKNPNKSKLTMVQYLTVIMEFVQN